MPVDLNLDYSSADSRQRSSNVKVTELGWASSPKSPKKAVAIARGSEIEAAKPAT